MYTQVGNTEKYMKTAHANAFYAYKAMDWEASNGSDLPLGQ